MPPKTCPCWIYKSPRKDELYLYLAAEGGFAAVPADLLERFGTPRPVIQIDLGPGRTLAREDVAKVMANLRARGYHLQLPPVLGHDAGRGD